MTDMKAAAAGANRVPASPAIMVKTAATDAASTATSDEDRGFFERAGDEVASWFGDEEAERRRREDVRRFEAMTMAGAADGAS